MIRRVKIFKNNPSPFFSPRKILIKPAIIYSILTFCCDIFEVKKTRKKRSVCVWRKKNLPLEFFLKRWFFFFCRKSAKSWREASFHISMTNERETDSRKHTKEAFPPFSCGNLLIYQSAIKKKHCAYTSLTLFCWWCTCTHNTRT